MATTNGDGSIVLSTKVDTKGINNGLSSIKGVVGKLGGAIAAAFSVKALISFGREAINLASDLQEVQNVVDVAFGNMSYKIEEFSKSAIENFGISELTAKRTASTYMAMAKGMGIADDVASDMAITMTGLTADIASFYNMSQERADVILKSVYTGETETLKQLGIVMTEVNLENFAMSKGITKSLKSMTQQEKTMLRYQFVLEQTSLAQGDFVRTQDSWANQTRILNERWKEMQTTFGETFVALGVLVLPIINSIIDGLKQVAVMLKVTASSLGLFKEETKESDGNAKNQNKQSKQTAENIKEQTENQKELNEEMNKSLAGFDEINVLSGETSNSGGENLENNFQDTGYGMGGKIDGSDAEEEVDRTLTAIMGAVSLGMVAIGLILLFTGHIAWGVGFVIAGAALLSVTAATASKFNYNEVIQMLTTIMGIAGGALLAIGIMLLWLGGPTVKAMAIGMIVAGGVLVVSAIATQAAFAPDDIGAWLSIIAGIAGGALLALGIIFCYFSMFPLGIGMIAAGVVSLVAAVALNSDSLTEKITGWVAVIMAIAGAALLALGIILTVAGNLILGIPLIAVGAIALITPIALNWNAIVDKAKEIFNAVIDWIKTYGLLVLGIILCLTGVGIPFGIALIVKWAKDGAEKGVPLATAIVDKVKEIWAAVKQFWNTYIAPIFTGKFWLDLAIKCANGLIAGFESGVNGVISLFEKMINWIVSQLNKISFDVPDWVPLIGGKTFGFNIPPVTIKRVSIPRLAQGAVIPANREFLAVLGDQKNGRNLEAPENLIRQIVREESGAGNRNITIQATGSMAQLIRMLNLEIREEQKRASVF